MSSCLHAQSRFVVGSDQLLLHKDHWAELGALCMDGILFARTRMLGQIASRAATTRAADMVQPISSGGLEDENDDEEVVE